MSEDQKKQLQTQLWNIANELRGKMGADEFRDYILGFIFYKYLSEKIELYANSILEQDGINYAEITTDTPQAEEIIEEVRKDTLDKLGYFLKPTELFSCIAREGETHENLIEELEHILTSIQNSTMGHTSEDDFESLFSEIDLNSPKLGKTVTQRNELIAKVLLHLNKMIEARDTFPCSNISHLPSLRILTQGPSFFEIHLIDSSFASLEATRLKITYPCHPSIVPHTNQ